MSEVQFYLIIFLPIISLALLVMIHVILGLFTARVLLNLFIAMLIGGFFLLVGQLYVFQKVGFDSDDVAYMVMNTVSYLNLGYGYFHFVNINIASLRIKMLHEISNQKQGMTRDELLNKYGVEQIVRNRLNRLEADGQIIAYSGRYFIGRKKTFLILFWFFECLKIIALGRGSKLLPRGHYVEIKKNIISIILKRQFVRFLLAGVINTVFGYTAFAALFLLGLDYRIALVCSTAMALLFNYYTNAKFVFFKTGLDSLCKFSIVNLSVFALNQAALITLVKMEFGALLAQAVLLPIIILCSFMLNRFWVFVKTAAI